MRIGSKSILKFWRNLMACLRIWVSKGKVSPLLWKPLFEGVAVFFHVSIYQLGEAIQLENLHSVFFSNNCFWYFRMVNDLEFVLRDVTFFVQQTNVWKMSFHSGSKAKFGSSCCLQLKPLKKRKLWWSPGQNYQCFKKRTLVGLSRYQFTSLNPRQTINE